MNSNKREKILLGGYEQWLSIEDKYSRCLMIYDSEKAQHGVPIDVMGTGNNIRISSNILTKTEKKELVNHLLSKNK